MKLSEAKSKIVGLGFKSIQVDTGGTAVPQMQFHLLAENGFLAGVLTLKSSDWSEELQAAFTEFADKVEAAALKYVFSIPEGGVPTEEKSKDNKEPAQF